MNTDVRATGPAVPPSERLIIFLGGLRPPELIAGGYGSGRVGAPFPSH